MIILVKNLRGRKSHFLMYNFLLPWHSLLPFTTWALKKCFILKGKIPPPSFAGVAFLKIMGNMPLSHSRNYPWHSFQLQNAFCCELINTYSQIIHIKTYKAWSCHISMHWQSQLITQRLPWQGYTHIKVSITGFISPVYDQPISINLHSNHILQYPSILPSNDNHWIRNIWSDCLGNYFTWPIRLLKKHTIDIKQTDNSQVS